ncbi:MAG TPA: MarR family winged helix-turn-helix transcriptional regulator [Gaiellaceae bacterium]|nr:MarR family winged helix-turn-helix transcriptional regulator [Gaiellaceae bacterium]
MSTQSLGAQAFISLMRAHAAATRRLNTQLIAEHGLTLSDFEVLLRLARAPDRRLRRVDLAEEVLLTASGITRLLDGLERQGFVERAACATDRRVVYAVITDHGLATLREAASSHFAQVEELFGDRYDERELAELESLLTRLGGASAGECGPPDG